VETPRKLVKMTISVARTRNRRIIASYESRTLPEPTC
jgi:hypothetical protein